MTNTQNAPTPAAQGFKRKRSFFSIAYKMAISIAFLLTLAMGLVWFLITTSIESPLEDQASNFGHSFANIAANSAAEMILAEDQLGLSVLVNNIIQDDNIIEAAVYARDGTLLAQAPAALLEQLPKSDSNNTVDNQAEAAAKKEQSAKESTTDKQPKATQSTKEEPKKPSTAEANEEQSLPAPEEESVTDLKLDETQSNPLSEAEGNNVPFMVSVRFKGVNAGYFKIILDKRRLQQPIRETLKKISIATLLITALSIVFAFYLGKILARPVDELVTAAHQIALNFEDKIDKKRDDEFGLIIQTLNQMAEGLEKKSAKVNTLSRLVPPTVVNELTHKNQDLNAGQYVYATVLFIDMVGFTSMAEKLRPQSVAAMLNRYFALINKVSKLYNGTVDKYIGDGAMVVFGSPQNDDEHCFHALCCARLFIQIVQHYNDNASSEDDGIQFRVGIHSGEMIAGVMGSDDRMQYTVIGDSVNLASRLCSIGPANQIIISESVLQEKEINKRIICEDYQEVLLKGKSQPTKSYRVMGMQDPYSQLIERQVQHLLKQSLKV